MSGNKNAEPPVRFSALTAGGVDGTRKRLGTCNRVNPSIVTIKIPHS